MPAWKGGIASSSVRSKAPTGTVNDALTRPPVPLSATLLADSCVAADTATPSPPAHVGKRGGTHLDGERARPVGARRVAREAGGRVGRTRGQADRELGGADGRGRRLLGHDVEVVGRVPQVEVGRLRRGDHRIVFQAERGGHGLAEVRIDDDAHGPLLARGEHDRFGIEVDDDLRRHRGVARLAGIQRGREQARIGGRGGRGTTPAGEREGHAQRPRESQGPLHEVRHCTAARAGQRLICDAQSRETGALAWRRDKRKVPAQRGRGGSRTPHGRRPCVQSPCHSQPCGKKAPAVACQGRRGCARLKG